MNYFSPITLTSMFKLITLIPSITLITLIIFTGVIFYRLVPGGDTPWMVVDLLNRKNMPQLCSACSVLNQIPVRHDPKGNNDRVILIGVMILTPASSPAWLCLSIILVIKIIRVITRFIRVIRVIRDIGVIRVPRASVSLSSYV